MWLLKVIILLALTQLVKTAKHGLLAFEKIHNEIAEIHERAQKYQLETEVYDTSPIQLHDWILERNTTWMDFGEKYGEMDLSEGIQEQNELLDLMEEEENSGYSDEIRQKIVEGFEQLDGFENRRKEIVGLDKKEIWEKVEKLKERLHGIRTIDKKQLEEYLSIVQSASENTYSLINNLINEYPKIETLPIDDKHKFFEKFEDINIFVYDTVSTVMRTQYNFERAGFLYIPEAIKYVQWQLIILMKVTDEVIPEMSTFKKWEELTLNLEVVSKAMERLRKLKNSSIKNVLKNVENDIGQLKNYKISEKVFNKYQGIPSLKTLLQTIRSFTAYMNRLELKMAHSSKKWKPFEEHFQDMHIYDEESTGKFEKLRKCIENYDFSTEISKDDELENVDNSFEQILTLNKEFTETMTRLLSYNNHPQIIALNPIREPEDLHDGIYQFLEVVKDDFKQLADWLKSSNALDTIRNFPNRTMEEVKTLDFDKIKMAVESSVDKLKSVGELLVCYDNLKVTSKDVQNLLDSTKGKWDFNPRVLESTVEVISMFKDAHKRLKEVSEWKPVNPSHKRFVLTAEGVQKITVVLEGLDSIRKVGKMWKNLKTLEIQNPDWELVSYALTTFFEQLSFVDSSLDFFTNSPFPANLPIDAVRKFIKEDYEGSHRRDILNFLDELQQLQYPTADSIKDLKEALKEIKAWEEEESKIQRFVDCSENTCDAVLKFPEVAPDVQ